MAGCTRVVRVRNHSMLHPGPQTVVVRVIVPVTFFVPSMMGVLVAGSGMTYCPCRMDDPGGVVTGPGGVGLTADRDTAPAWVVSS